MTHVRFEWDERKNLLNERKHGITFKQAAQIFRDPAYVSVPERIEDGEQRWQSFGLVNGVLLLMVAHTVREENVIEVVIRIITARRANSRERRHYEDEND